MRIDALNKVSKLYQANSTNKITKKNNVSNPDCVEISQIGKEYQIAKQAVAATPDVRLDKVNDIKERMASGTYNVSAKELADKLVDSYFDQSI